MITKLAGCILLDTNNKIGLLHRNKKGVTQWELPGGKVEPGEHDADAAIRELQEELGVTVKIEREIGSTTFESDATKYEYTWFLASIKKGTPKVCEPDSFDDFSYFTLKELEEIELSGNMQQLLKQLKSKTVNLL